jgi:hypothetical protein
MAAAAWAIGSVLAYALAARGIFRYTIRRGLLIEEDHSCSHGYQQLHRGADCHGTAPLGEVARGFVALGMALVFPLVVVLAIVMYNPPRHPGELEAHIKDLERELGIK